MILKKKDWKLNFSGKQREITRTHLRFQGDVQIAVLQEMEEVVEIESSFPVLFPRLLEDLLGIGNGAVHFALMLRKEPEQLVGGHGGGAFGEFRKGFLDVGRWFRFGDGELSVEAAEDFVVVSGHGEMKPNPMA